MLEIAGVHILPEFPRFLTFVLAGLALNIVPGADLAYIAASSARSGARAGLAATFGIAAGALVHIAAAVAGVSALIASSQTAFTVLKWLGAIYLLWIAIGLLRRPSSATLPQLEPAVPGSSWGIFRAGALVNLLNPKVGIFFLAFLPQFVSPGAEMPAVQILTLGLWFNFAGSIVNALIALAVAGVASGLREMTWVGNAARWLAATIMGGLAVQLLVSERR